MSFSYRPARLVFSGLLLLASATALSAKESDLDSARSAAEGVNRFALDLYRAVRAGEKNLFFSPTSVSVALAMTREGAKGKTAAEMDKVFHFAAQRTASQRALRLALAPPLVSDWTPRGKRRQVKAFELSMANAVWGQEGLPLQPEFLEVLERDYTAPLERLDFAQVAAARKRINDWVAKRTHERIKDIIKPPLPYKSTRLALANAIYFKAAWAKPFQPQATREAPFHLLSGKTTPAKLMRKVEHFRYAEDSAVQVLELGYRGQKTSMVVILPRTKDGLRELETTLTHKGLTKWLKALRSTKVNVRLPRFKVTAPLNLTKTLAAMGMPTAFDAQRADFSGMTTKVPLFIGAVLHKAFVAVDEKGTEAAAATVVLMAAGGVPRPVQPKQFVADHPFLFLIRQRETGCILFLGRLTNPATD
jgi:serpin B